MVDHRAEDGQVPVPVVEDLEQPVLLRPVGQRGGPDAPKAVAAAGSGERGDLV